MRDKLRPDPSTPKKMKRACSTDRAAIALNLVMLAMNSWGVPHISLIARDEEVQTLAYATDTDVVQEWNAIPVTFYLIRRRLTIMTNVPRPWWHSLQFWNRLSNQRTEKIDRRFWHPPLATKGGFKLVINNEPHWGTFEAVSKNAWSFGSRRRSRCCNSVGGRCLNYRLAS